MYIKYKTRTGLERVVSCSINVGAKAIELLLLMGAKIIKVEVQ